MWELSDRWEEQSTSQLQGHTHPCNCHTHRAREGPLLTPQLSPVKWALEKAGSQGFRSGGPSLK